MLWRGRGAAYFNPRSPRGERLPEGSTGRLHRIFQSTLPARGATMLARVTSDCLPISIHAPREGSDRPVGGVCRQCAYFNPRSPRGERLTGDWEKALGGLFQSTLPARGATHPARAGRRRKSKFQSTLPARGATNDDKYSRRQIEISIHAPREGSDIRADWRKLLGFDFNPRSPRGERRLTIYSCCPFYRFQSTLPARGATR